MKSRVKRVVKHTAQLALLLVLTYCWYLYVKKHWPHVRGFGEAVRWSNLAGGMVFTMLGYAIRGMLWSPFYHELTGKRLGLWNAFRISSIAWMGRYLPGKVWALAGKAYLSSADKSEVPGSAVAATVDVLWLLASGMLMTLGFLGGNSAAREVLGGHSSVAWIVAGLGVLACHPRVFFPLANTLLRWTRQPPLLRPPRFWVMMLFLVANVVCFGFWTAGFVVMIEPGLLLDASRFCETAGVFAGAWVFGFAVLLAPAGIGVRDSILALGLQHVVGLPPDLVVAGVAISRILTTLAESLCFLVAIAGPPICSVARRVSGRSPFRQ